MRHICHNDISNSYSFSPGLTKNDPHSRNLSRFLKAGPKVDPSLDTYPPMMNIPKKALYPAEADAGCEAAVYMTMLPGP